MATPAVVDNTNPYHDGKTREDKHSCYGILCALDIKCGKGFIRAIITEEVYLRPDMQKRQWIFFGASIAARRTALSLVRAVRFHIL